MGRTKPTRAIIYNEPAKLMQLKKQPGEWLGSVSLLPWLKFLGGGIFVIWLLVQFTTFAFLFLPLVTIWGVVQLNKEPLTISKELRITNQHISKLVEKDGKEYFYDVFEFTERSYFELIILPKDDICKITIEAFSEVLIAFQIPTTELMGFMDKLQNLTAVEIYDSYQTKQKEDVICFRSIAEKDEKLPFLNKITASNIRLFINPRTNSANFIINFQRNIMSTYKNDNYKIADIQSMEYEITEKEIIIKANDLNAKNIELIRFKKDRFTDYMIQTDMKKLFNYLEEKPALQHIQFV